MNRTNSNIEWASWSWNPVTGCPYCYAREMAHRFSDTFHDFEPTFYPERLSEPSDTRVPQKAARDLAARNIFVSSMGDLFGEWVPREWIDAVLSTTRANPQWNFLFLTKNPKRYLEFNFPGNSWLGTTIERQSRVADALSVFERLEAPVKWLSCEPLSERLTFPTLEPFDWLVIGGFSRSRASGLNRTMVEWVEDLLRQARESRVAVYVKPNIFLVNRPREYPMK
jgi:protein gp37